MDEHRTTEALERLADQIFAPMPPAASLAERGTLLTRRRRRWRIGAAAAVVVLLLLGFTFLNAVRIDRSGTDVAGQPGEVVTAVDQVRGDWFLIRVQGDPPPDDSVRQLSIGSGERAGDPFRFGWDDTINLVSVGAELDGDQRLRLRSRTSTLVGCSIEYAPTANPGRGRSVPTTGAPPEATCEQPAGIGIADGNQMRLDHDDLLFLDEDGREVAAYRQRD